MPLKPYTIYENEGIDLRRIKCACNHSQCKIGLSFDSVDSKTKSTEQDPVLRLHDKYGNEHHMHLDKRVIKKLIKELQEYLY